jgi:hypothetical protein
MLISMPTGSSTIRGVFQVIFRFLTVQLHAQLVDQLKGSRRLGGTARVHLGRDLGEGCFFVFPNRRTFS